mgnify:CR=1 FL=1
MNPTHVFHRQLHHDLPLAVSGQGISLTDAQGKTSLAKVWAGGDCRFGGRDLTVEAVEHGKQSALAIDAFLRKG